MTVPWSLQAVVLCALLTLSPGCSLHQQSVASIEILEGCLVRITGISNTQASEIVKTWDIDPDCQVEVNTRAE